MSWCPLRTQRRRREPKNGSCLKPLETLLTISSCAPQFLHFCCLGSSSAQPKCRIPHFGHLASGILPSLIAELLPPIGTLSGMPLARLRQGQWSISYCSVLLSQVRISSVSLPPVGKFSPPSPSVGAPVKVRVHPGCKVTSTFPAIAP